MRVGGDSVTHVSRRPWGDDDPRAGIEHNVGQRAVWRQGGVLDSVWLTCVPHARGARAGARIDLPPGKEHHALCIAQIPSQLLPDETEELAPGTTALKSTSVSEAFGILRNALPRMFTAAM